VFILVDIGVFSSQSDEDVFKESIFGRALEFGAIKLPSDLPLPNTNNICFHIILSEMKFSQNIRLKSYILRFYSGMNLNIEKRIFNYWLSKSDEQLKMHLAFCHQDDEYYKIILLLM